jgi:hypothetical protein
MDGEIVYNGRSVALQVSQTGGLPGSTAQFGFMVAEAVLAALHYPLAIAVKTITIAVARTVTDISIEISGERTRSRIQRQVNTAQAYSSYLLILQDDHSWDPGIKADLEYSLREDLKSELKRIRW